MTMKHKEQYDKIIIGAGLYGLYSAYFCAGRGQRVLVLECDDAPFRRATYINQARVHQGYHYPRSLSTAMKSAGYFARFNKDYGFCINREFQKVYATSSEYSWSDGSQFRKFCEAADIPCEELPPGRFFKDGMCDGVFLTREYTYDAMILKAYFEEKLREMGSLVEIRFGADIERIERTQDAYVLHVREKDRLQEYRSGFVLNATYASTNQILDLLGFDKFGIKYELCEIILCDVNDKLREYGFTVMDGPFFRSCRLERRGCTRSRRSRSRRMRQAMMPFRRLHARRTATASAPAGTLATAMTARQSQGLPFRTWRIWRASICGRSTGLRTGIPCFR